jgi:hypothetical protein
MKITSILIVIVSILSIMSYVYADIPHVPSKGLKVRQLDHADMYDGFQIKCDASIPEGTELEIDKLETDGDGSTSAESVDEMCPSIDFVDGTYLLAPGKDITISSEGNIEGAEFAPYRLTFNAHVEVGGITYKFVKKHICIKSARNRITRLYEKFIFNPDPDVSAGESVISWASDPAGFWLYVLPFNSADKGKIAYFFLCYIPPQRPVVRLEYANYKIKCDASIPAETKLTFLSLIPQEEAPKPIDFLDGTYTLVSGEDVSVASEGKIESGELLVPKQVHFSARIDVGEKSYMFICKQMDMCLTESPASILHKKFILNPDPSVFDGESIISWASDPAGFWLYALPFNCTYIGAIAYFYLCYIPPEPLVVEPVRY